MTKFICKYAEPTEHEWLPTARKCQVWHCYRPLDDQQVAHGHVRYATINDDPGGQIIEGANYICVRHIYCNPSCYCYEQSTDSSDR